MLNGEIRDVDPGTRHFTAHKAPLDAALRQYNERSPELQAAIDAAEVFLLTVFVGRYVTYYAGKRRYAAMNEAARVLRVLNATAR